MSLREHDELSVELRALRTLAEDTGLELPDPRLDRRLELAAERRSAANGRLHQGAWPMPRVVRWAASIALGIALTGATAKATGVLDQLWNWWYQIQIGDQQVIGVMDGEGRVKADYTTPDGYRVTVTLSRNETVDGGQRTRVETREEGQGKIEMEREEVMLRSSGTMDRQRYFGLEVLAGTRVLHTWTDANNRARTLHLGPDPDGPGSRLFAHDPALGGERPVLLLLRTDDRIAVGGQVSITEDEDGVLVILIDDGHGHEIMATCGSRLRLEATGLPSPESPMEYETPSGRVKVRVGDLPPKKRD